MKIFFWDEKPRTLRMSKVKIVCCKLRCKNCNKIYATSRQDRWTCNLRFLWKHIINSLSRRISLKNAILLKSLWISVIVFMKRYQKTTLKASARTRYSIYFLHMKLSLKIESFIISIFHYLLQLLLDYAHCNYNI